MCASDIKGRIAGAHSGALMDAPLHAEWCRVSPSPSTPLTFVVQRAIEVVTAGVEAGGQLNEVAGPRVAGAREAGECDELLRLGWEEPSVHAPIVCRRTDRRVCTVRPGDMVIHGRGGALYVLCPTGG